MNPTQSFWNSGLPTLDAVLALRPELAECAKAVYDAWEQGADGWDDELGLGGICQDVAAAMAGRLGERGIEHVMHVHANVGENHVFLVALLYDGVYSIDIPPYVYEEGGGYVWRKKSGAAFPPECVDVVRVGEPMEPSAFEDAYSD